MSKVAIVIPCYNEASRLDFQKLDSAIEQYDFLDILLVNDGSTDNTWELLEDFKASRNSSRVMTLNIAVNSGKGEAVRQGLRFIVSIGNYEYAGYWDADLAAPLDELPAMVSIMKKDNEIAVVIGARVLLSGRTIIRSAIKHYVGRVFATMVNLVFRLEIYDTQCGAKIFRVGIIDQVTESRFCSRWIFDVELLYRIKLLEEGNSRLKVYEKPLHTWIDIKGSKVSISSYFFSFWDFLVLTGRYKFL